MSRVLDDLFDHYYYDERFSLEREMAGPLPEEKEIARKELLGMIKLYAKTTGKEIEICTSHFEHQVLEETGELFSDEKIYLPVSEDGKVIDMRSVLNHLLPNRVAMFYASSEGY